MASKQFQVLSMTTQGIQDAIKASLQNPPDVEDYTFEERYCRGVNRVVRPKQDEVRTPAPAPHPLQVDIVCT